MPDSIVWDDDGRLNLEQQRRRAKELRAAAAQADADAISRIRAHLPKAVPPFKLADAQHVVARELGMPSWPKLKAHLDGLDQARAAIAGHAPAPDGDRATLHIRCGSDIRLKLQQAGFMGAFLEVSDPYCQGPVPRDGDLLAVRAAFLADAFGMAPADARARLAAEYDALANAAAQAERLVLWFEHDSYDQLLLARVLAALAHQRPVPTELVCLDHYPGLTRYIGLGQLSPPALRAAWTGRTAVGPAQYRLGTSVWDALRDPSPAALFALAAGGTPEIPVMAAALRRHLRELPWVGDGLSLTQRLTLRTLGDGGQTVAQMFTALQLRTDPLPFLGDLMFRAILRGLTAGGAVRTEPGTDDTPWPQRPMALAPTGERLLAGETDWLDLATTERWVGGVRIEPGRPGWRWNGAADRPVRLH